ncbi:protein of unknown function (DUF3472) [Thaumarchaeota archaeon SCGC AB-539-E09]|nr:protein of unknown function (DUF3472) [Thaumarchaeota archaeon SCGC AB-539-E09]
MDNAKLCIDWNISDIDKYEVDIEILSPTPEYLRKGLIFFQWHFNFLGEGGYIGLQLSDNVKKAIFSIWQPIKGYDGECISEMGKPVYRCLHDFCWELNQKYRMIVKLGEEEQDNLWWIGEIYDYKNDRITTIGKILLPRTFEKLKGHNYYTCIETGYFEDNNVIPEIKVRYSNSLAYKYDDKNMLKDKLKKFTIFMINKSEKSKVVINNDLSYILEAGGRICR